MEEATVGRVEAGVIGIVEHKGVVFGVHNVDFSPWIRETYIAVERNLGFAFFTALGGDNNYTVCGTGTVDGT